MSATPPGSATSTAHLRHRHDHGRGAARHERRTQWVVGLTFAMMVGELIVGYATNSLALTADGWHMATHVGALGMAAAAYWFARTRAHVEEFSFGTGKVHALAGYTSAIVLAVVALWMVVESIQRLVSPEVIAFDEALPVAVLGLAVNLVSAALLHHDADAEHDQAHPHPHAHAHGHEHAQAHEHAAGARAHHDHNLRAAYLHVLADALTSVLAIAALVGGRYLGWTFLDAAMGVVGGAVIARWSYGLAVGAAGQLLDVLPSRELATRIRARIEALGDTEIVDLHVWEIGPGARACILSVATPAPRPAAVYRDLLLAHERIDHLTVEVHALPAASA